jgi:hypothetical protein
MQFSVSNRKFPFAMKKSLLVFLTWILFNVILLTIHACGDDCDGPIYSQLQAIESTIKKLDGDFQNDYQPKEQGIRFDSVGINVTGDSKISLLNSQGQFIEQAVACDPVIIFEKLDQISITSSEDYSDEYVKGSELRNIMLARSGYALEGFNLSEVETDRDDKNQVLFTFNSPPKESKIHDLTITYKFENGKELQTTIKGLKINIAE